MSFYLSQFWNSNPVDLFLSNLGKLTYAKLYMLGLLKSCYTMVYNILCSLMRRRVGIDFFKKGVGVMNRKFVWLPETSEKKLNDSLIWRNHEIS